MQRRGPVPAQTRPAREAPLRTPSKLPWSRDSWSLRNTHLPRRSRAADRRPEAAGTALQAFRRSRWSPEATPDALEASRATVITSAEDPPRIRLRDRRSSPLPDPGPLRYLSATTFGSATKTFGRVRITALYDTLIIALLD